MEWLPFEVRRATLESIGALLQHEATMMDHMEDVLPHLNLLLNDRTASVRQCLAETLERWLLKGLSFRTPSSFDDGSGGLVGAVHMDICGLEGPF